MAKSNPLQLRQVPSHNLKLTQHLIMSAQLQQAIRMLQMPVLELATEIEAELEQNPLLENADEEESQDVELQNLIDESSEEPEDQETPVEEELQFDENHFDVLRQLDQDLRDHFNESGPPIVQKDSEDEKFKSYQEQSICSKCSLFEYLMKQASQVFETPEDLSAAESIIGNLDESGFLTMSLEEISHFHGIAVNRLKKVLKKVQALDPPGIAAQDMQDSLLIQLELQNKQNTLAYQIVQKHYDDLLHNRIPVIQKKLGSTAEEIHEAVVEDIAKLDLHPSGNYTETYTQFIVPDVTIKEDDGKLIVFSNHEVIPTLRINRRYLRMLDDSTVSAETKEFIKQKLTSAKWLLRNLMQRGDTLERIAQVLVQNQKEFFTDPQGKLHPQTMKEIAEELSLHESTIARAVSNKYVATSRGTLPFRSFFTNSYTTQEGDDISSQTVRDELFKIVEEENKKKPLSDEAISKRLKEKGIICARRTVAKYRELLSLGTAHQRKRYE